MAFGSRKHFKIISLWSNIEIVCTGKSIWVWEPLLAVTSLKLCIPITDFLWIIMEFVFSHWRKSFETIGLLEKVETKLKRDAMTERWVKIYLLKTQWVSIAIHTRFNNFLLSKESRMPVTYCTRNMVFWLVTLFWLA